MSNAVSIAQSGSNNVTMRNRIINGSMVIDQRNAGASVTATTDGYTIDRFALNISQASKLSFQQNAGSVTPPTGFTNYLGFTSLSAYAVTSSDYFILQQPIEGFNVADLGWGAASAQTVTLSFWVRSSLTGTFGGSFTNSAVNRSYPFTYTISSANTWEQKSITVAGDTSGTWVTNNGVGIRLYLGLGVGSTRSGTAGAWAAGDFRTATGATSVVGTNGATFYITGVQLEKGSTATPFEQRLYGTELALCQRYYWQLDGTSAPYTVTGITGGTDAIHTIWNPVPMRAAPSASFASGSFLAYYFASAGAGQSSTSIVQGVNSVSFNTAVNGSRFYFAKGGQAGLVAWCDFGVATGKFTFSSEL